jgi:NADPH-dependent 7-cyano-7-deazaguanine reductase QueF-like protein
MPNVKGMTNAQAQNLIESKYSKVMLNLFPHLSFSITDRSWHEVMNECESTSSG